MGLTCQSDAYDDRESSISVMALSQLRKSFREGLHCLDGCHKGAEGSVASDVMNSKADID